MARPRAEKQQAEVLRFRTDLLSRLRTFRISLFYDNNMSDLIENRLFLHVQAEEKRLGIAKPSGQVAAKTPKYATYNDLPPLLRAKVDGVSALIKDLVGGASEEQVKAAFEDLIADKSQPKTKRLVPKEKRAYLSDLFEVSIYCDIPAGWAEDRQITKPKRTIKLHRSQYKPGMFGLDVTGESMNAAKGKLGPICPGDTVLLVPFTSACDAAGKIVAATIDGRTTLKRMVCPEGKEPCYLQPESNRPEFSGAMHPANEITILGVVVDKL